MNKISDLRRGELGVENGGVLVAGGLALVGGRDEGLGGGVEGGVGRGRRCGWG